MTFDELQKTTGVTFTNPALLKQAFYHRSYLNESKTVRESNERLEFLGDAVLSFLTSHYLYDKFPTYPEGTLTNLRSSLVKTKTLAHISTTLCFGQLLFLSKGEEDTGGRTNTSLLADAFEAFLGALFLDQGIEKARTFLSEFLFPTIDDIIKNKSYVDYKSFLQELIQESIKISPNYEVVKTEGPDHNRTFWIHAISNGSVLGGGTGKSKQDAEQMAAKDALEKMGKI